MTGLQRGMPKLGEGHFSVALLVLAASSISAFTPTSIVHSAQNIMRTSHMSSSRQFLCGVRPQRNARRRSLFHMSAARGDACLAAAANALGAGDIVGAQENLDKARMEYMRAGVDDRNELVEQIRSRVEIALNQETRDAKKIDSASEFAERLRLSKQEGDNVMSEAAKMLSRKNFEAARMLALKARDLFQQASPEIARERQAVLGNLMSYIQIEEEREALMKKRKARKEREDREQRELEERLEQAAMAVMEGEPVQKRPTNPPLASTRLPCLAVAEAGELPDLCMLVDNGSSRAATTLELRRISQRLGDAIGMPVLPVSMAHADKASLEQLGGKPAKLFLDELRARCLQDSVSSVVVVPLFFGPTLAVSSKIPDALKEVAAEKSVQAAAAFKEASLKWSVADPLCEDAGLAPLLAQEIERAIATHRSECADASAMPSVVLVDHGSPSPKVAGVRDAVAEALSKTLTGRLAQSVTAASMERRPGPEYAFCDPLLSDALPRIGDGESDVVLSLMFLLPGTHAGPQGDIDQICEAALDEAGVKRRVVKTRLVGELDGLVQLLVRRFAHALARL